MKFMKEVGANEVSIPENAQKDEASNWTEEYASTDVKETEKLSKEWANEHLESDLNGIY